MTERSAPSGTGSGAGSGAGEGGGVPPAASVGTPGEVFRLPAVVETLLLLGLLVAGLVLLAYALVHWRTTVALAVGGVVFLLLLIALSQVLPPLSVRSLPPALDPGGGGGSGGSGTETAPQSPPLLAVLLVVGLVVVAAAAVFRSAGGRDDDTADGEAGTEAGTGTPDDGRAAAVGRVAGRAASRIEGEAGVDNEVYRAWREMTGLLDVSAPATSTPGEFAAAAVAAGLGREDVAELTRLFEAVRYGETPATAAHERRAVAVFRRIEDRYAATDGSAEADP